nr:hypothetical protein [Tanacetum cinerariifolium]
MLPHSDLLDSIHHSPPRAITTLLPLHLHRAPPPLPPAPSPFKTPPLPHSTPHHLHPMAATLYTTAGFLTFAATLVTSSPQPHEPPPPSSYRMGVFVFLLYGSPEKGVCLFDYTAQ